MRPIKNEIFLLKKKTKQINPEVHRHADVFFFRSATKDISFDCFFSVDSRCSWRNEIKKRFIGFVRSSLYGQLFFFRRISFALSDARVCHWIEKRIILNCLFVSEASPKLDYVNRFRLILISRRILACLDLWIGFPRHWCCPYFLLLLLLLLLF